MKTIVFIAMLCMSCALQAHVFCVYEEDATGDAACTDGYCGLIQALAAVSDGGAYNGEDSYIEVVAGVYHTNGTPFLFVSTANPGHIMDISGGFSAGCLSQLQSPRVTVLSGGGTSRVLALDNSYGATGVRWLTIQDGSYGSGGGGCEVNGQQTGNVGGEVNFNYNIVRNNTSTFAGGGCYLRTHVAIRMFSNLFKGNSAPQFGAVEVVAEGTFAYLYNNTFTLNTSSAPVQIGAVSYGGNNGQLINNIFYGNTGGDIWAFVPVTASNNDYHDFGGDMPVPGTNGNIDADPLFVGPANLRVDNGSPTIASGTITAPGDLPTIDIQGYARTYNGLVDMGAYSHDVIFNDGFDDN